MVTVPSLEVERTLWESGRLRVVGVDGVGIGSLCGPIVSAALLLPPNCLTIDGVRDSKTLSASQRDRLFIEITHQAVAIGIGVASVVEIEKINVLNAANLSMQRALARVGAYDHALIDGRDIPQFDSRLHTAIIRGDASSYAIACASIVAKVRRDRFMKRLAARYPDYGWERNAGYGTKEHIEALRKLGVTPFHRRTYAPIREILSERESEKVRSQKSKK